MTNRNEKIEMSSPCVSTWTASDLRQQWEERAIVEVWSGRSHGWYTPAVDAVSEALTFGSPRLRSACIAFGAQRAEAGVSVDEARAEIRIAVEIAGLNPLASFATDAVTFGWVDRSLDRIFSTSCLDPLTELASLPYLTTRIDEISAEARFRGQDPRETAALIVVRTELSADPLERETNMVTVQVALRSAFRAGETLARLGPNVAAALVRRDGADLPNALMALRVELDRAVSEQRLAAASAWLEPIPADREAFGGWVRDIS